MSLHLIWVSSSALASATPATNGSGPVADCGDVSAAAAAAAAAVDVDVGANDDVDVDAGAHVDGDDVAGSGCDGAKVADISPYESSSCAAIFLHAFFINTQNFL